MAAYVVGGMLGLAGAAYIGIKLFAPWLLVDIKYIRKVTISYAIPFMRDIKNNVFLIDRFAQTVKRIPNKVMLVYEEERFTYLEANICMNKMAQTAVRLGLKQNDVVALVLQNEPDFIWCYMGLQKAGIQMAFINFNLRNEALVHVIKVAEPKMVFVSKDISLQETVAEIQEELGELPIYNFGESRHPSFKSLDKLIEASDGDDVSRDLRKGVQMRDNCAFVYTSGTTGLPKAAYVTHEKVIKGSKAMSIMDFSENDVLYEVMPLYHSAASMLGLGLIAITGGTFVLKKKFSASQFMNDCRKHNVTVIQYIGEILRYLAATDPKSTDSDHCIRAAFGNGLRKDIWRVMQTRFKIPVIYEFYAATEMPVGLANLSNKFGAVGRLSPFMKLTMPLEFVLFDKENEDVVRNEKGLCIPAPIGKPGLLLIPLNEKRKLTFEGYKGQENSKKKMVYNVCKHGDCYINTGDAFILDKDYFIYFSDRLGDTFRWKGENVSTTEVANILTELDFIHDTCVYGVEIPGCEGRAGMAAICLHDAENLKLTRENLDAVAKICQSQLPHYARPRFLRLLKEITHTNTFKQSKLVLKEEGFDLDRIGLPVYFLDCKSNIYKEMDAEMWEKIKTGEIKF